MIQERLEETIDASQWLFRTGIKETEKNLSRLERKNVIDIAKQLYRYSIGELKLEDYQVRVYRGILEGLDDLKRLVIRRDLMSEGKGKRMEFINDKAGIANFREGEFYRKVASYFWQEFKPSVIKDGNGNNRFNIRYPRDPTVRESLYVIEEGKRQSA